VEGSSNAEEARAWNAPFAQPGHRAALKAWPRLQTELAVPPADLLQQWAQAGRLWLQPAAAAARICRAMAGSLAAGRAATGGAGQCLAANPAWRSVLQHAGRGAAAVEYFAP
jgi:tRNA(adenine34) deaminase